LLGRAFAEYVHDHDDALPPAVVEDGTNITSWDREIAIYLEPELAKQNSEAKQKQLEMRITYLYKCPSDREPRGGAAPRSYSMPIYDINLAAWPPQAESIGGLGLYLDSTSIKQARGADAAASANELPAIKTSIVKAPADTALLVEHINILNALFSPKLAGIASPKEQFEARTFAAKDFHGGRMNYLMLDGHVELLSLQSLSLAGMWTIRPGD
jgi:prepilin-type processing-associated H-X9-DG protein